jgi:hypothetical protein
MESWFRVRNWTARRFNVLAQIKLGEVFQNWSKRLGNYPASRTHQGKSVLVSQANDGSFHASRFSFGAKKVANRKPCQSSANRYRSHSNPGNLIARLTNEKVALNQAMMSEFAGYKKTPSCKGFWLLRNCQYGVI